MTKKGEKKDVNGFGRSVRWSEELSFRANHRYIINGAMATMGDHMELSLLY